MIGIEQFIIIYTIGGMFLMLPAWAGAHTLFEEDDNSDIKIGVIVFIFGGPGVWTTAFILYIGYNLIKLIGKAVDYTQAKLEEMKDEH